MIYLILLYYMRYRIFYIIIYYAIVIHESCILIEINEM